MMQENNTEDKSKKERKTYYNYDIFPGKISLVEGKNVTIMERDKAIELAKSKGMSLVQVGYNKNTSPRSICKIMDLGKMKYEQKKKDRENARKSRIANAEAKEIVFSIRIDDGDFKHKLNQINDFLMKDNLKVKITVKLNRREMGVKYMATDLIKKILSNFDGIATLDGTPSDTGRLISCTIKPMRK